MTLWERVERLEKRIGELEAQPRITLDGDVELRKRIEALESKFEPDDVVDTLLREVNSLDRLVCGSSADDEHPCLLDRVKALESLLQVDAERQRRAIERGLVPPPPPYEERMLKEACGLLKRWLSCRRYLDLDSDLDVTTDSLLARARVAGEKP